MIPNKLILHVDSINPVERLVLASTFRGVAQGAINLCPTFYYVIKSVHILLIIDITLAKIDFSFFTLGQVFLTAKLYLTEIGLKYPLDETYICFA